MRLIYYFTLFAILTSCWGKAEDINEISENQPPIKLDSNLRKALLKALNDLESEEKAKLSQALQPASRQIGPYSVRAIVPDAIPNGILEKASSSSFSIITQSENPSKSTTTTQKQPTNQNVTTTEKPVVIVQKSNGIQHRPITSFIPTSRPAVDPLYDSEQFVASASSSFTGAPKFQSGKSSTPQPRSVASRINSNQVSITVKPRTAEVTTVAPIITSSTEESEAKVEDVQFFAAPLVAAFTVHHDELGLPKSVEPIYKVSGQNSVSTKDLEERRLKQAAAQRQRQREEQYKEEQRKLQQYLRNQEQNRLQFDLEEKQRVLEQQLRSLQQQQQHQDYLLRQQQLFQEQNLLQQRQKLVDDQKAVLKNQQRTRTSSLFENPNQNRFNNQFTNHQQKPVENKGISSLVSFEPSITFQPAPQIDNTLLPPIIQQLPITNAVDFRQSHFPAIQLPIKAADDFRQPPQYPPISDQQSFGKFNLGSLQSPPTREFQNFNFRPNVPVQQSNRVFRQEAGTGNFFNPEFNNRVKLFNPSPPQQNGNHFNQNPPQSTRFFRSNPDSFSITPSISQDFSGIQNGRRPVVNNQLNNLLYHSGITKGNQQEDLNIVSKVLSLNHLGLDNFFGGSQILEQRLTPPQKNVKT